MEWKNYKLSEIGEIVGGATPSTKISEYYDGDIPWISPKDLSNFEGKYISCGSKNITELGFNSCSCKILPKGSVLFSSRAPIGYIAIAKNSLCTNQGFKSVIPNRSIIDSEFLYYTLVFNKEYIKNQGSGTTFMEVSGKTMGNIEVSIPVNLSDQRKIAGILSALDSKIENNNKINANLEAQAEALFKSWFVDFTPFKDQPFVDSELGPIPQGWKVGKLGDIGEIVGGSTPSKSKPEYYTTHGIAWLTPKDLSTSKAKFTSRGEIDITDEGYNSTSTKLMPRGSVLFSSRAPIGYLTIAKNEICTNQGFKSLVPNGAGTGFIYYTLRHLTPQIENRATGSTFKEASATLMRSVETIVPPTSILNKFEELLRPILQFQEKKEEENQRLAALRDTLLPKLMSGEIKL